MYSPLDAHLIAARQQELAAAAVQAHHRRELLGIKRASSARRPVTRRLRVRVLGVFAVARAR